LTGFVDKKYHFRKIREVTGKPDYFSDLPSDSIALNGFAKSFGNRQTKAKSGRSNSSDTKAQPIPKQTRSFFKNTLKLGMGSQCGSIADQGIPHRSESNAKFFAPAQSSSFQNISATYSRHSLSETVSFGAFAFIWIISKAHDISPEFEVE